MSKFKTKYLIYDVKTDKVSLVDEKPKDTGSLLSVRQLATSEALARRVQNVLDFKDYTLVNIAYGFGVTDVVPEQYGITRKELNSEFGFYQEMVQKHRQMNDGIQVKNYRDTAARE